MTTATEPGKAHTARGGVSELWKRSSESNLVRDKWLNQQFCLDKMTPMDVGIAAELNLAGVGQHSAPLWEEVGTRSQPKVS